LWDIQAGVEYMKNKKKIFAIGMVAIFLLSVAPSISVLGLEVAVPKNDIKDVLKFVRKDGETPFSKIDPFTIKAKPPFLKKHSNWCYLINTGDESVTVDIKIGDWDEDYNGYLDNHFTLISIRGTLAEKNVVKKVRIQKGEKVEVVVEFRLSISDGDVQVSHFMYVYDSDNYNDYLQQEVRGERGWPGGESKPYFRINPLISSLLKYVPRLNWFFYQI
jgi:hypothetical protein